MIRGAFALAVLGVLVLAAPAQALQLGPDTPHSPNTEDMATAYWVMIVVGVVIGVAINGALIAALVRFKAKRGRAPARVTAGRGAIDAPSPPVSGVSRSRSSSSASSSADRARTVDDSGP